MYIPKQYLLLEMEEKPTPLEWCSYSPKVAIKMPLWPIFSHSDTFSLEQRAALARDVTALYSFLPVLYVNVIFISSGENDI
jgi:hypothetical protein